MAVKALSQTQLEELESGLKKLVAPGATVAPIDAIDIGDIEKEFCAIWPKAKPIIVKIAEYVRWIPRVGSIAAAILIGLVDGLDLLSRAIGCKSHG